VDQTKSTLNQKLQPSDKNLGYSYDNPMLVLLTMALHETMTYSEWLRFKRVRSQLCQEELAESLGVSKQTVSSWETGRSIPKLTPLQTLILCDKLGCSLSDLAGFERELKAS
jgi:DNA-binding XRE family transcriptional regulator